MRHVFREGGRAEGGAGGVGEEGGERGVLLFYPFPIAQFPFMLVDTHVGAGVLFVCTL